jgi:hypothetical protein
MFKEVTMDSSNSNNSSKTLGYARNFLNGVLVPFSATLLVAGCLAADGMAGGVGSP